MSEYPQTGGFRLEKNAVLFQKEVQRYFYDLLYFLLIKDSIYMHFT